MRRIRQHLTFANVVSVIALFVALGGTALASVIITSNSQIGPGTVSGHKPPTGKHANIIAGSINGTDIADRSGVDTCPSPATGKFGPICAGSDGGARQWNSALDYCTGLSLRLPTTSEAGALAKKYDVPGVTTQAFWTDEATGSSSAVAVTEGGAVEDFADSFNNQTVCVTDPSA
jgi:hypothetical protein